MLRDIIKKEILETITSPKFVFTFLLCAVLILLSVYTGITNYRAEQKEYTAAVALNKKNLESQPNYQSLAGLGTKINRPPQVLGTIASGVERGRRPGGLGQHRLRSEPGRLQVREQPRLLGLRGARPDLHRQDRPQPVRHPLHLRRHRRREGAGAR